MGGVNIDNGTPAYTAVFEFDATSTFSEQNKIYAEKKDNGVNPDSAVKGPEGWKYGVLGSYYVWTDSKLTVASVSVLGDDHTAVFGNGHAITVEQLEEGKIKISLDDAPTDHLVLEQTNLSLAVFGGKNGENVKMIIRY